MGLEFLDWKFYVIFYLVIFLYGIVIGSFLNVCIYRLPENESLVKRSSHCMTCGHKLSVSDLFPLFSWIFLKGKCRYCGSKIAARYPIVEGLNGILYVLVFGVMTDFSVDGFFEALIPPAITAIMFSALIVVGFMDWDTLEIDLRVLGFIAVTGILSAVFTDSLSMSQRIIGAIVISVPFFLIGEISGAVIKKRTGEKIRGIELGDTVLMAVAGFSIGTKAIIVSAFAGIILAAVCGMIYKRVTGSSKFAFGPFLSIGIAVGTLWGESLVDAYIAYAQSLSQI